MPERIILLGSTGSIGTQALDIISKYPERFKVDVLVGGNNVSLLTTQAEIFQPATIVIGNIAHYKQLKKNLTGKDIKVLAGESGMEEAVAGSEAETVLAAIVGYSGLKSVLTSINAGKKIALANKETLVVAGALIKELARISGSTIIPVDSEHSAIFQCLTGEKSKTVESITLTASGGPFLRTPARRLKDVKPCDALKHPNWNMGDKVTIDSATMMNKGLEVIEARWLFDLDPQKINVIIHPQSVIHSFVHFIDGSVKAQLGIPDMRLPILYALTYPERLNSDLPRLDLTACSSLTFLKPDFKKFRNLALAYMAINEGGNMPCSLNAANEIAVRSFLSGKIGFLQIPDVIEFTIDKNEHIASPDLDALESSDRQARETALSYIKKHQYQ
jgi:1-deoxy-D-xylulose-5-phosphate reductoisomerase